MTSAVIDPSDDYLMRQHTMHEDDHRREACGHQASGERHSPTPALHPDDEDGAAPSPALRPHVVAAQPSGWLVVDEGLLAGGESKKRWCFLMRAFLFHADSQKQLTHPKGCIDLKGCSVGLARASGTSPSSPALHLPCAFVISHPRRPTVTFTASSDEEREAWMRALHSAITTPTHALLSYKGRHIFDEEDAREINASQQAIRGFVSEQFHRLAAKKEAISQRIQRKKADVKTLKAQKKSLATKLIAMTKEYEEALAEAENLSQSLTQVQREARNYDGSQRAFFLQLVSILNDLDESDINRWSSAGEGSGRAGLHGDEDECDDEEDGEDDGHERGAGGWLRTTSPRRSPRQEHPADRAARNMKSLRSPSQMTPQIGRTFGQSAQPHRPPVALLESELIDSGWTPTVPANVHMPMHDAFAVGQPAYGSSPVRRAQFARTGPRLAPSQSNLGDLMGGTVAALAPYGRPTLGSPPLARSKTSANISTILGSGSGCDDPETSEIDLSNEQLRHVQARVRTLLHAPLDAGSGAPLSADAAPTPTAGSYMGTPGSLGVSMSMSMASHSAPATLLALSRSDVLELEESRKSLLDLLSTTVTLRLEQNLLTRYIEAWMRRKHAIALLRME